MSINFRCEHCGKHVEAPKEAAGKRGKCPYCGQSNYIPSPVSEEDILPLAPVDEQEERRHDKELKELLEQERSLIAEKKSRPAPPLEQREDVKPDDLYHLVVNYCLDVTKNNQKRADMLVQKLSRFGGSGLQAVEDFISGKAIEPALDPIPSKTLQTILTELRERLQA